MLEEGPETREESLQHQRHRGGMDWEARGKRYLDTGLGPSEPGLASSSRIVATSSLNISYRQKVPRCRSRSRSVRTTFVSMI